MAVLPTRILEIEFDAGVWTDVTADFVELSTRRGRNRELGAFETGSLVFTLRNDARKYDPDNTAGPYYGKLRPNRRVRLRATYAAVTYPIFVGYIDRISQISEGPNAGAATFDASDFFKLLNRAELPTSGYVAEVAADLPVSFWRLDEPAGSTTVRDSIGSHDLITTGTPEFGQPGMISREPGGAVGLAGFEGFIREGVFPLTASPLTIELVYRHVGLGGYLAGIQSGMPGVTGTSAYIGITAGGDVFEVTINGGVITTTSITGLINDGLAHHLAMRWDGGVVSLFVDGILRNTPPAHATGAFTATSGQTFIGGGPIGFGTDAAEGDYQAVAFYNYGVPDARIAAHAAQMFTPWNGDLPGTRLGRIFDLAAVPAADRLIDAGTTPLQSSDLGGDALSYAQKVEETELGWLFVARDGKLRFIGRAAAATGAYLTSLATLVDADSGAGIPYRAGDADVDEATIVTRSTASRAGSVAVTVYDTAAKTEFGWLDETHEGLLHDSDVYSRSYAEWILNTHKAPASRLGAVTLELTAEPAAMYPAILALEIADRVTWKRKPQNVGAVTSIDMRVDAISHETGGGYWRTRLQLSPFNLAAGLPVFVWDSTRWDQHVWGI